MLYQDIFVMENDYFRYHIVYISCSIQHLPCSIYHIYNTICIKRLHHLTCFMYCIDRTYFYDLYHITFYNYIQCIYHTTYIVIVYSIYYISIVSGESSGQMPMTTLASQSFSNWQCLSSYARVYEVEPCGDVCPPASTGNRAE